MGFLAFIGFIFILLLGFFACYCVIQFVCNPTPGNNAYCRVTNRAKRELEQKMYGYMQGIIGFMLAFIVLSLAYRG